MSGGEVIKAFLVGNDEFISDLTIQLSRLNYDICGCGKASEKSIAQIASSAADVVVFGVLCGRPTDDVDYIGQLRKKCDLPVVLISDASNSLVVDQIDDFEFIEPLALPFDGRLLRATIRLVVSEHRSGRQRIHASEPARSKGDENSLLENANWNLAAEFRKKTDVERTLRLTEERLSLALLSSRQGQWEWNLSTHEVSVWPESFEFLGFFPDDVALEYPFQLKDVHPDDLPSVKQAIEENLRGDTEISIVEYRIKRTDGTFQWVCGVTKVIERDVTESPVRVIGSISNIDERKQTELSLRQFRQAIESANNGIILFDAKPPGHSITYVNTAFTRLTGYSAGESIGRDFQFLDGADQGQKGQKELQRAISGGHACRAVLQSRRKDGALLWCDVNIAPVTGHNGELTRFFGVLHDITTSKVVEDAVRRNRAKLSATLDSISDAVLAMDMDGHITLMNQVAERLTGWTQAEAFGLPATDVFRLRDSGGRPRQMFPRDQILTRGTSWGSDPERYLETRDGLRIPIDDNLSPIRDQDGNVLGEVLVFRDLTTERSAARQINSLFKDLQDFKVALDEHCIVSIADADGRLTYVNDKFCTIVKAARDELIGEFFGILESGHHPDEFFEAIRVTVINGRTWHGEVCCMARDKSLFWVDTTIVPFLAADGKPYQYVVIKSDITARKLAEDRIHRDIAVRKQAEEILRRSNDELEKLVNDRTAKLGESEERLRIFVENVPAGVAMFDRDMRYLAHSNRWRTDYQIGNQNLIGQSYYECFPRLPERLRNIHQRCLNGDAAQCEEDPFELPDGSTEYFRWEIQPWHDSFGVVGGLVVFTERITEKRLAQLALQESEDRFRQIAMSIDHVFWIYVLPERKYLYVSPTYEKIWGRAVSELYADSNAWMKNIHPDDRQRLRDELRAWGQNPTETELDFRIIRDDGEMRWMCIRGISIRRDQGTHVRIAGVVEDVTEKKLAESQALQSQKLQAVGQLAGGIAHDFNNFLLLISCYTDQLLDRLSSGDPSRPAVIAIRDAGTRAARLTSQLLTFSHKKVIDMVAVDLNEQIARAMQLVRGAIRGDVLLKLDLSADPATINANPGQVDQVILNLILNAQDAMPDGGRLTIRTCERVMPAKRTAGDNRSLPQRFVHLIVSDTGTGMTDEVQSRMFEPYFSTKNVGKGTGLGLAVVHGIVTQCGGSIHVESVRGVGTDIEISFPASDDEVVRQVEQVSECRNVAGAEAILLVEDDNSVREVLKTALESQGYRVLEAAHGPSAIAKAIRHNGPIDLLLTDVLMPEMSGGEVARALSDRFPDLPTIFMSGFADYELLLQEVGDRTSSFLQKPFEKRDLFEKIKEALDNLAMRPQ